MTKKGQRRLGLQKRIAGRNFLGCAVKSGGTGVAIAKETGWRRNRIAEILTRQEPFVIRIRLNFCATSAVNRDKGGGGLVRKSRGHGKWSKKMECLRIRRKECALVVLTAALHERKELNPLEEV